MKKNIKGFTLIELIIALAIFSVVVFMAFSILVFGNKSFSNGTDRSDVQFDFRMTSSFITDELRNATEVQILSTMPATPTTGYNYIYISGKKIISVKNGTSTNKTDAVVDTPVNSLFKITKLANNNNILEFNLMNTKNNVSIDSKVYFNNINGVADATGDVIRYKLPK